MGDWVTVKPKKKTPKPSNQEAQNSKKDTTLAVGSGFWANDVKKPGLGTGGGRQKVSYGSSVDYQKKATVGVNKQKKQTSTTTFRKLDEVDLDTYKLDTIPRHVATKIAQARAAKGLNQKQLATMINEKQTVIAEIENGKAIYNRATIAKIERALGAKVQ